MEKYATEVVIRIINAIWWKRRAPLGLYHFVISPPPNVLFFLKKKLTKKVNTAMTSVHSVTREKAAQSQSEAFVLMCSCASGGLEPSASFLRTSHSGTNMASSREQRKGG